MNVKLVYVFFFKDTATTEIYTLSLHDALPIRSLADVARLEGLREARPPRARVELVERAEERLAGHDVHVDPRLMVVPVLVVERRLGGLVLGHLVLPRRQRAAQLGVAWLPEVHRVPSFRATLGARAPGGGAQGER